MSKRKDEELFSEFLKFVKKRKEEDLEEEGFSPIPPSEDWETEYLEEEEDIFSEDSKMEIKSETEKEQKDIIIIDEDELNDEVTKILGKVAEKPATEGLPLHPELAKRWKTILTKGLNKEDKEEIINKYPVPSNLTECTVPKLNPEVNMAVQDHARKRDQSIYEKQRLLAAAISSIGQVLSSSLKSGLPIKDIEKVNDGVRLLCEYFQKENLCRRNLVLNAVKPELRDNLIKREPNTFLFGNDLAEDLKSAKAIARAGQDLKKQVNYQGPPTQFRGGKKAAPKPSSGRGPRQYQARPNYQMPYNFSAARQHPPAPRRGYQPGRSRPLQSAVRGRRNNTTNPRRSGD